MRLLSQKNHGCYTKIRGKIEQTCLEARVGLSCLEARVG
nr:MAG TPA: hypothetical protein [Caudoviricetes sp.]